MNKLELKALRAEFPEGIPQWMLDRNMTAAEIRDAMLLRRKAFPKTRKT